MPASNTAPPNPANPANPAATPESGPRLLADHVALDLLNTIERADTTPRDHWQTDADVLAWLKQVALWPGDDRAAPPKGLATAARALREAVRLIVARKADGKAGGSHLAVHPVPDGGVRIARIHAAGNAAQCLVPLAEAVADLLAHGDFGRVRQCESDECTLWFYDRTKSHRRRWCSMAVCGNRHKVAAFRKREAAADEDAA